MEISHNMKARLTKKNIWYYIGNLLVTQNSQSFGINRRKNVKFQDEV